MVLISGPAIAKLCLRTRKWAHEHLRRGSFGLVIEHDGTIFAELPAVELHSGMHFTAEQIEAAVGGYSTRKLTLKD
jgi:hypothetical protein